MEPVTEPVMAPCDYPYGHKKNDMCYKCYLKEQEAYGFSPLSEELWQYWRNEACK